MAASETQAYGVIGRSGLDGRERIEEIFGATGKQLTEAAQVFRNQQGFTKKLMAPFMLA